MTDPTSFGPSGTVPTTYTVDPNGVNVVTPTDLSGVSVFFTGWVPTTSYTPTEDTALYNYVLGGGALIATTDDQEHTMVSVFGLTQGSDEGGSPTNNTITDASSPLADGPFGTVSNYQQWGDTGYYSSLGPYAVAVGSNQWGVSLAVIPPGALGPGSGPVILSADVDVFSNAYPGGAYNETLIKNIFAYVAKVETAATTQTSVYDATDNSAWGGTEATGASAYDTATVTGINGITPTGSVTYNLFTNGACTGTPTSDTVTLNPDGTVPNSVSTGPLGAGGYSFDASYSGGGTYQSSSSGCEPFSVAEGSASVGTVVDDTASNGGWVGNEATGASAYDTATVTGAGAIAPTGSVTYNFFSNGTCSLPASTTDTVTLSGGVAPNSGPTAPLGAGNYSFDASYSGDANYTASTSECEDFSVATASASPGTAVDDAATNQAWGATEATGASAYDTATVIGVAGFTPTGTVTYNFFTNGTCAGTPSTTDPVTLVAGAVANSGPTGPLGAGNYSFDASYSGDANYSGSASGCEPFGVAKTSASPGTIVNDAASNGPWGENEVTGASAYDTATVTATGGIAPTGTVTYNFFANSTCAGTPSTTDPVTLVAGAVANSGTTGALGAGNYTFDASYSGDANYAASTSECEAFSVAKTSASPGTAVDDSTTGAAWDWTEGTGASAYDTSTVTGVASFTPTGTVTYNFFANGTCAGTPSTADPVTLVAGAVANSGPTGALGAGNYSFDASYSGDANYTASTSDCEPFGVAKGSSSVGTVVDDAASNGAWGGTEATGASAYDSATVSGVAGFTATGTVTYNFFTNGTCTFPATATQVTLNGGAVPSSSPTGALGAGNYSFDASYSGDSNYTSSTSGCETFDVAKTSSSVLTAVDDATAGALWTGTEATGASAYDTSTLSGVAGITPAGTVTYSFFTNGTCTLPAATTDSVAMNGGAAPNSGPTGALGAGSYSYDASYSGDGNYSGSTSSCEPFSVAKTSASPGTVVFDAGTNKAWNGTEATGASAYDTSTLSGVAGITPTGTVTYSFFHNSTCTLPAATTDSVALNGGTVPNSGPTGALGAGPYSFQASYSGDGNYSGSPSSCEAFGVATAPASPGTVVDDAASNAPWGGNEVIGASAYDTATVTSTGGITPTGTVTYNFFNNGTCTFPATATQVTLSGGAVPNSSPTGALDVGSYSFDASYSGDSNYASSTSGCESFSVAKASASPGTAVDDATTTAAWGGTETTGASAYDTSTISGIAGFTPTGTVTYNFFTNGTCTLPASATDPVTLSSGTVPNSTKTPALDAGSYSFQASYSGDSNYNGSSSSCEPFNVAAAPASVGTVVDDSATNAAWRGTEVTGASAYDTSTISGVAGFTPTGTVTYSLFTNDTCTLPASATDTVTVSGGTVPKSSLSPGLNAGSYSFQASYSGDPNYRPSVSPCEPFSVAKDTTTTTVSESKTSVTYGNESVAVFSVTVTTKHGEAVPNGETVSVDVGNATCTATLTAGKGTCAIAETALPVGSYSVSATYGGDANLAGSSVTCGGKLTVSKDTTAATVSVAPTSVTYGNESAALFSVTVTTHYGEAVPNGDTVTVDVGSATCTATLTAGKGTCAIAETALPVGSYSASSVSATYGGDANLSRSSASGATKLSVTKDTTTTAVSVSPTSVAPGNESTAVFSVTVTTHDGEAVPRGETVTVTVGSASCTVTLNAGKGTCEITKSALKAGSYSVTATYGGDVNLNGSSATGAAKLTVT